MANQRRLDERTLQLIAKEFNSIKKGTPYKNYRITDFIDSGRSATVYAVESFYGGMIGERLGGKIGGKSGERKLALRIAADEKNDGSEPKNSRELRAVRQLMNEGQKHIVEYLMSFEVRTDSGVFYCTLMPFLNTLSKYQCTADDIELAVRCGNDLLPLLQKCMKKKIIHRDIKPQNIFFDGDFRNDTGLLLGDFGEAKREDDGSMTKIGTPYTVSPEIACFDKDISDNLSLCDMYSLGIVMYYYLNGRVYPFGNSEKAYSQRLSNKSTLPPPKYGSKRLKQLVLKATQYYPAKRYSSPLEMLRELRMCDEYNEFILKTDPSLEETQIPDTFMASQIARLQAENRAIREKALTYRRMLEEMKNQNTQQPSDNASASRRQEERGVRQDVASRQPSASRNPGQRAPERLAVRVGSRLTFGSYPQTADGKTEPLLWRVLDVSDGKALIITEKLIDYKRFNDKLTEVTWEDSSLRVWLNGEFMTAAFGNLHPARVLPVTNRNEGMTSPGYGGYSPTRDQAFVLSAEEAKRYFTSDEDMIAYTTDYAHTQKYDFEDRTDDWWLRSSCADRKNVACVNHSGGIKKSGCDVNYYNVAVRPALWLKL